MSREIKFRGKRIDSGEWVYGDVLNRINTLSKDKAIVVFDGYVIPKSVKVFKESIGQYTGLKDKNGVEIYEGDVVWCRAGEHRSGVWEYENRFVVEYGWSQSMWEMSMCDEIELIGNIHDNPELLGSTP